MNLDTQFKAIIQADDKYPVDFDKAWKWVGWSRKQTAEECLYRNFQEGIDYLPLGVNNTGKRGKPLKKIHLSINCFKQFCMLSQTQEGRDIRQYFIEVEERFHRLREFSTAKDNVKLKESRHRIIGHFRRSGCNKKDQYATLSRRQTQIVTGLTPRQIRECRNPKAKTGRELLTEREQTGMILEETLTILNIIDNEPKDFLDVLDCVEQTVPEINRVFHKSPKAIQMLEQLRLAV